MGDPLSPPGGTPPPASPLSGVDQLDLFAPAEGIVGAHHPDTSRLAALEVAPRTGTQRARVLDYIRTRGSRGATDAEIQHALGMNGNTERPRRIELVEGGWLTDSGLRRTVSGRPAIVWSASVVTVNTKGRT
jgi:hypothetical protein